MKVIYYFLMCFSMAACSTYSSIVDNSSYWTFDPYPQESLNFVDDSCYLIIFDGIGEGRDTLKGKFNSTEKKIIVRFEDQNKFNLSRKVYTIKSDSTVEDKSLKRIFYRID